VTAAILAAKWVAKTIVISLQPSFSRFGGARHARTRRFVSVSEDQTP
jgi:hypothetical protein